MSFCDLFEGVGILTISSGDEVDVIGQVVAELGRDCVDDFAFRGFTPGVVCRTLVVHFRSRIDHGIVGLSLDVHDLGSEIGADLRRGGLGEGLEVQTQSALHLAGECSVGLEIGECGLAARGGQLFVQVVACLVDLAHPSLGVADYCLIIGDTFCYDVIDLGLVPIDDQRIVRDGLFAGVDESNGFIIFVGVFHRDILCGVREATGHEEDEEQCSEQKLFKRTHM